MAAQRRGQAPLIVDLPRGSPIKTSYDLPPISALFLIYFDLKAGYTISWKRFLLGIELESVVEYKSLPSGLHTVKEDLIYFVHGEYAGLSAFVNAPDLEANRNAKMIAVGVLVPLSFGRLGKSWKHAENLATMAQQLVRDTENTKVLEEYWDVHKAEEVTAKSSPESIDNQSQTPRSQNGFKKRHGRNRSASDGTSLLPPGQTLSSNHPAWSLSKLLTIFGPLLFPIYRAALLRKRILISCHAPVQEVCDFVYILSVLSNIPLAMTSLLQTESPPPQRLRPLFSIGVHDIPLLVEDHKFIQRTRSSVATEDSDYSEELGHGWVACTTDGILGMKKDLYDILIVLPQPTSTSSHSNWPTATSSSSPEPIRATQRDLRRYKALKWSLDRSFSTSTPSSPSLSRQITSSSSPSLLQDRSHETSTIRPRAEDPLLSIPDTDTIIEPLSWSALAYTGFMWWASAGERTITMDDEFSSDMSLLDNLTTSNPSPETPKSRAGSRDYANAVLGRTDEQTAGPSKELAIIAYFHRLTSLILTTLSDIVDGADSDDERNDGIPQNNEVNEDESSGLDGRIVYVSSNDMDKMGLDSWSLSDHVFVESMCEAYFGRKAVVEGNAVDVCGIRIC